MDWNPTEDMRLCQELAKKFAAEFLAPAQRRHEADRALAPEVLAKFDELGLARIDWPVDDGGAGLGLLDRCVVLEALATADAGAVPALNHNALAWQALARKKQTDLAYEDWLDTVRTIEIGDDDEPPPLER